MPTIIIRHQVADFSKWKPAFDQHEATRRQYGITGHTLHRQADNPSMVLIVMQVEDLERARAFAASDDLKKVMRTAGVMGTPELFFCNDVEAKEYEARAPMEAAQAPSEAPLRH